MDSSYWSAILAQLLAQSPALCVLLGGIVAACVFWDRHPRPALLVVVAALLLGAVAVAYPLSSFWLAHLQITHAWTFQQFGLRSMLLAVLLSGLQAIGYGLLFVAAFSSRFPAAPLPPPLPTDPRLL